jgi:hypothetical protein
LSNSSLNTAYQCVFSKNQLPAIDKHKLDRLDADQLTGDVSPNNQTNLAIKGIIAIRAMSNMSLAAGNTADADKYSVCNNSFDILHWD